VLICLHSDFFERVLEANENVWTLLNSAMQSGDGFKLTFIEASDEKQLEDLVDLGDVVEEQYIAPMGIEHVIWIHLRFF
jgi:hypothetical protein